MPCLLMGRWGGVGWGRGAVCDGRVSLSGIHPAAHLDPGPSGHDIYGRHGHALGLTAVGLDPKEAEGELNRRRAAPVNSCDLLSRSRALLARSLMRLGEGDVGEGECVWVIPTSG